jgi:hypothetical protein
MTIWLLGAACLLVPALWAAALARLIDRRAQRRARRLRDGAPRTDFEI